MKTIASTRGSVSSVSMEDMLGANRIFLKQARAMEAFDMLTQSMKRRLRACEPRVFGKLYAPLMREENPTPEQTALRKVVADVAKERQICTRCYSSVLEASRYANVVVHDHCGLCDGPREPPAPSAA